MYAVKWMLVGGAIVFASAMITIKLSKKPSK